MAERKPISKTLRFEVFKRDKFTCQYCGRMAPDVILEVDHIKPVAEGGKNNILNLITSCRDCNRGKGKKLLSDDAVVKIQQEQLLELADKREQLDMMLQWKKQLLKYSMYEVECCVDFFLECTEYKSYFECDDMENIREQINNVMKHYIKQFSVNEVIQAIEISVKQYYVFGDIKSFRNALKKIGGICYYTRKQREENHGNLQGNSDVILDRLEDS